MRWFKPKFVAGVLFAAGVSAAAVLPVQAAHQPKAVIELFTSQGCSSCPPADRFFNELTEDSQDVVALSYHVDYWDYLGWKDTLGSPMFTQRQRDYARARRDAQVYTPQMVLNGLDHMVGSQRAVVSEAIDDSAPMQVDVKAMLTDDALRVQLSGGTLANGEKADVYLLGVDKEVVVPIERGENAGTQQTYRNVVRGMMPIGMWSGGDDVFSLSLTSLKMLNANGWAVLVQKSKGELPGEIIGATLFSK